MNAVPKGQSEAAYSLGMRKMKVTMKIVFPQAVRYVIPSLISQLVVVVKDTGELPRYAAERARAHH